MESHQFSYLTLVLNFLNTYNVLSGAVHNISENSPFYYSSEYTDNLQKQMMIIDGDFCGPNACYNTDTTWYSINPACDPCSCEDVCFIYDNCCPYISLNNNLSYTKPDYICKKPGSKPSKKSERYWLKSTCPKGVPVDLRHKCEVSQDLDFEIQNPVFGTVDNIEVIFKNKFCAGCNGVKAVGHFTAHIRCDSSVHVFVNSTSYLETFNMAMVADDCTVDHLYNGVAKCQQSDEEGYKLIETCNETGNWLEYDELVEEACLLKAYRRPVYDTYYNLFCYICNNNYTWGEIRFNLIYINDILVAMNSLKLEASIPQVLTNLSSANGCFNIDDTGHCREIICPYQRVYSPEFRSCQDIIVSNAYGYDICFVVESLLQNPSSAVSKLRHVIHNILMSLAWSGMRTRLSKIYDVEMWTCNGVMKYKFQVRLNLFMMRFGSRNNYEGAIVRILNEFQIKPASKCGQLTRYSQYEDDCSVKVIPNTGALEIIPDDNEFAMVANSVVYLPFSELTGCCQMILNPSEYTVDSHQYLFILNSNQSIQDGDYILNEDKTAIVCMNDYVAFPYISPCNPRLHNISPMADPVQNGETSVDDTLQNDEEPDLNQNGERKEPNPIHSSGGRNELPSLVKNVANHIQMIIEYNLILVLLISL